MMEAPVAVVSKLVRNSRHEDSAPDQPKGAEDTSSCLGLVRRTPESSRPWARNLGPIDNRRAQESEPTGGSRAGTCLWVGWLVPALDPPLVRALPKGPPGSWNLSAGSI